MELKISDLDPQFENIARELGIEKQSYYLKNLERHLCTFLLKK